MLSKKFQTDKISFKENYNSMGGKKSVLKQAKPKRRGAGEMKVAKYVISEEVIIL